MTHNLLAFTPFDPWHMLVLGLIALLLFGKRLPEVGRSLGRGISEFKKGLHDVQEELNRENDPPPRQKLSPPEDVAALPQQPATVERTTKSVQNPPAEEPPAI